MSGGRPFSNAIKPAENIGAKTAAKLAAYPLTTYLLTHKAVPNYLADEPSPLHDRLDAKPVGSDTGPIAARLGEVGIVGRGTMCDVAVTPKHRVKALEGPRR